MKIFNLIFAIIFLFFAALQYNDPDPFVWIFIYGMMTLTCALAAWGKFYNKIALALALIYLAYSIALTPSTYQILTTAPSSLFDEIATMRNIQIEEARECLGLLICLVVLAIDYFFFKKKN